MRGRIASSVLTAMLIIALAAQLPADERKLTVKMPDDSTNTSIDIAVSDDGKWGVIVFSSTRPGTNQRDITAQSFKWVDKKNKFKLFKSPRNLTAGVTTPPNKQNLFNRSNAYFNINEFIITADNFIDNDPFNPQLSSTIFGIKLRSNGTPKGTLVSLLTSDNSLFRSKSKGAATAGGDNVIFYRQQPVFRGANPSFGALGSSSRNFGIIQPRLLLEGTYNIDNTPRVPCVVDVLPIPSQDANGGLGSDYLFGIANQYDPGVDGPTSERAYVFLFTSDSLNGLEKVDQEQLYTEYSTGIRLTAWGNRRVGALYQDRLTNDFFLDVFNVLDDNGNPSEFIQRERTVNLNHDLDFVDARRFQLGARIRFIGKSGHSSPSAGEPVGFIAGYRKKKGRFYLLDYDEDGNKLASRKTKKVGKNVSEFKSIIVNGKTIIAYIDKLANSSKVRLLIVDEP